MEMFPNPINKVYEVEKIINCKFYKNKKYYLIKWLCYPISESTWEPKSNIKNLSAMLDKFEAEYPYSGTKLTDCKSCCKRHCKKNQSMHFLY